MLVVELQDVELFLMSVPASLSDAANSAPRVNIWYAAISPMMKCGVLSVHHRSCDEYFSS